MAVEAGSAAPLGGQRAEKRHLEQLDAVEDGLRRNEVRERARGAVEAVRFG
jgi:hypothetical protein